jgi:penicillin-binding protein 1C
VARREGVPFARQAMPLMAPHLASAGAAQQTRRASSRRSTPLQGAVERLAAQERAYFDDGARFPSSWWRTARATFSPMGGT